MYEPILDMAEEHLKKLYNDVLALTWGAQLNLGRGRSRKEVAEVQGVKRETPV